LPGFYETVEKKSHSEERLSTCYLFINLWICRQIYQIYRQSNFQIFY